MHSVGPTLVDAWINNPNGVSQLYLYSCDKFLTVCRILANSLVTAVIWAGLPGEQSGPSIADVLYGVVNPSGRLPYTIAKQSSDWPTRK